MTDWPEALIEDYLNLLSNFTTLSSVIDETIDKLLEEMATDFSDGSIPFVEAGFLAEDNSALTWDNVNRILSALDIIIPNLTPSRLVSSDSNKKLVSVANLASWIAGESSEIDVIDDLDGTITISISSLYLINNLFGTTNQIIVTDNLDGSVTLSTPQDIHTGATPTFVDLLLSGAKIDTQTITPTDLEINCGANKTIALTEVVYEDLRVPAQNTRLNPSKSEPNFESLIGGLFAYKFDTSNADDESVHFIAQMPHSYKEGSDIYPHIHWCPDSTDTGDVYWSFEYVITNINGTIGSTTTDEITVPADGTALKHQVDAFAAINGTGLTISNLIVCRLTRRSSSQATDTYTGNACFLEFDFHYEIDTLGSRQEFIK